MVEKSLNFFAMAILISIIFCKPTLGATWRANEQNTVMVELRECETAAEDGILVGIETVENTSQFVFAERKIVPRSHEIRYFLYKDKLWWMGVFKWKNSSKGNGFRAERRFFCFAASMEEPSLNSRR